jgi:nucleoside-diphosphate-sugar epimerase
MLAAHLDAPVHIFRPFSGYGTDQDDTYPFPAYIARAAGRCDPFDIWGDGEQTRDFIHIDDIVAAVLTAIDQDVRGPVNLGTGRPTSFNELAALVASQVGYQPEARHVLDKPVGPEWRVADTTSMEEFFTPSVCLEDGIRRALCR